MIVFMQERMENKAKRQAIPIIIHCFVERGRCSKKNVSVVNAFNSFVENWVIEDRCFFSCLISSVLDSIFPVRERGVDNVEFSRGFNK